MQATLKKSAKPGSKWLLSGSFLLSVRETEKRGDLRGLQPRKICAKYLRHNCPLLSPKLRSKTMEDTIRLSYTTTKNGIESEMFSKEKQRAHCSFEFTYFAHPSSKMEGANIYVSRKNIGRFLAKKFMKMITS